MSNNRHSPIYIIILGLSFCSYCFADCGLIDKQVEQVMSANKINGIAIAIFYNNKTNFCNYGYTASDKKQKIDQHTLFEIASISKTFTATLAGIATTQGKFDLQKPISSYIGNLQSNQAYSRINSQELLAHVSGMNFIQERNFQQLDQVSFINTVNTYKAQYKPETYYKYGQVGTSLVAIALEKSYKLPFESILHRELLDKLEMNETFINIPSSYKNMAMGYDKDNNPVESFDTGVLTLAAGLKSSTQDLVKYLKWQLESSNDNTLSQALNMVHKNYYCLYKDGTYQQLAWVYHPYNDLDSIMKPSKGNVISNKAQKLARHCLNDSNGFIEKTGNSYGMSSYIIYHPNTANGVIVLVNKARAVDSVNLGRQILKQIIKHQQEAM